MPIQPHVKWVPGSCPGNKVGGEPFRTAFKKQWSHVSDPQPTICLYGVDRENLVFLM
jgi:hypothetical protein